MQKSLPRSYFQFKKFRIVQDRCAMKVCTDACIQGALAARTLTVEKPKTALDIGAGTGLLSLMLAQNMRFNRQHAIEINEAAAEQARENIAASSFKDRILLFQGDVRAFTFQQEYEFIISNPPFYENALKSPSDIKNTAMHASHLTYVELVNRISDLLTSAGSCCIMVPHASMHSFVAIARSRKLYPSEIWKIRQTEKHSFFRAVLFFKRTEQTPLFRKLMIKGADGRYSSEFEDLLRPYYLFL